MPVLPSRKPKLKEGRLNSSDLLKIDKLKNYYYKMDSYILGVQQNLRQNQTSPFAKEFNKTLAKEYINLAKGSKIFKVILKKFLNTKSLKIPAKIIKAFARLNAMKKAFELKYNKMERKFRIIEERKIKAEYKETSIKGIKFRPWKKRDVTGFSKFVSEKASSGKLIRKLLKNNKYLWNPKGNPELYFQQQCVETSIVLLIQYCYKNKINLVLPAGGTHLALSNFKTIESFMAALYPRLSASHLFSGGGGIITEIPKDKVKPGDIYTAKHPNGGYHAQLVIKNNKGRMQYLSGTQLNKDFRKSPHVRAKIEKTYPIGFIKAQPNAKPKDVQMRYGGYASTPMIKDNQGQRMLTLIGEDPKKFDTIKYYRIDPTKMNAMITKLA